MNCDRESSQHQWVLAVPVNRHLEATSGERIFLGIMIFVVAMIVVLITAHVIASPSPTLN